MVSKFSVVLLLSVFLAACDQGRPKDMLPPQGFIGNSLHGKSLYRINCARCHGSPNHEKTTAPHLFSEEYFATKTQDLRFYIAVKKGFDDDTNQYPAMPAQKEIDARDIAHIVAFIRKQQQR